MYTLKEPTEGDNMEEASSYTTDIIVISASHGGGKQY